MPLAAMELMGAATLLLLVLAAVALVARWQKERSRNLPPGPLALPLVGNLLQLGTGPTYKVFRKVRGAGPTPPGGAPGCGAPQGCWVRDGEPRGCCSSPGTPHRAP